MAAIPDNGPASSQIEPVIFRLADDVRAKILAHPRDIQQAKGKITLTIFRNRGGYNIELNVTK